MPFPLEKIRRLVVLVMENRSFDHMFGKMMSRGYPIDGLTGAESNPDSSQREVHVTFDARTAGDFATDPGHDYPDVNMQIFSDREAKTISGPLMKGFVQNYEAHTRNPAGSHRIMKCLTADKIPALSGLARQYAICDRWFSSVPGPALPNRSFLHSATSQLGEGETIYERLHKWG